MQLQHQEQAQEELTNGRKRRAEESTSLFDWFWDSGDIPEGNEPIADLIKDELWTNPMRGSSDSVQVLICTALLLFALVLARLLGLLHSTMAFMLSCLAVLPAMACLLTLCLFSQVLLVCSAWNLHL